MKKLVDAFSEDSSTAGLLDELDDLVSDEMRSCAKRAFGQSFDIAPVLHAGVEFFNRKAPVGSEADDALWSQFRPDYHKKLVKQFVKKNKLLITPDGKIRQNQMKRDTYLHVGNNRYYPFRPMPTEIIYRAIETEREGVDRVIERFQARSKFLEAIVKGQKEQPNIDNYELALRLGLVDFGEDIEDAA